MRFFITQCFSHVFLFLEVVNYIAFSKTELQFSSQMQRRALYAGLGLILWSNTGFLLEG